MNICNEIGSIYVTLMSVILAGVFNMIFVKLPVFEKMYVPMDGGKTLSDGKRLFGDNKTWKGFFGMILLGGFAQVIWGTVCNIIPVLRESNMLYTVHHAGFLIDLCAGLLFGFAYALFELPNSFIKRRLDIKAGKTDKGIKGIIFYIIDQIDSLLGVVLCLALICHISFAQYWLCIFVGFFTHSAVNLILYALKIRRNI